MEDCIFCKIVRGEIPSDKVYEDEDILCFRDVNPQTPVHLLVIPKNHVPKLSDIDVESAKYIGKIFEKIPSITRGAGLDKGFRVVANCGEYAGQTVFHIHFHILGGKRFSPVF